MRLLILMPKCSGPGNHRKWNSEWSVELEQKIASSYWRVFTPALLALAAIAQELHIGVDIVDEEFDSVSLDIHYDLVAICSITPNAQRCYEWSSIYMKKGVHVAIGGVHATVCPDEVKSHCDTILIGEGEYIWRTFLFDFVSGNALKEYKQEQGIVDLIHSPTPAFELLPNKYYELIPIQTSRGCTHGCVFCNVSSLYGSTCRYKTLQQVEQELSRVAELFGNARIYFTDDNFFANPVRAKKVLDLLHQYSFTWCANTDATFGLNFELIERAYLCGCRGVLIGFESISKRALTNIDRKNFKCNISSLYEKIISSIQGAGIGVAGSFMVGLDTDTDDTYFDLVRFIQSNGLYGVNITMRTPYPGTPLFNTLSTQNRILTYDWNQYTIYQPVVRYEELTTEQIQERYKMLMEYIYSEDAVRERLTILKEQLKVKNKKMWS